MKIFSDFYFSSYREKFIENCQFLKQKWRKMTKTRKIKIGQIWSDSSFNRFALNGILEWPATLCFFFNFSKFHEKPRISWMERKTKFQILPIFIFRVLVILWRRKIKIAEFWNLVLLSIQPIADLSCKFEKWEKKLEIFNFLKNVRKKKFSFVLL